MRLQALRSSVKLQKAWELAPKLLVAVAPGFLPLFLWRFGFEVADSGWAAVLARDFFDRPEMPAKAAPWFLTWALSAIVVGGNFSLAPLRIGATVPLVLTAATTFLIFWRLGHRTWWTAIGVAAAGAAAHGTFGLYFLNYNTLSALFLIGSVGLLLVARREAESQRHLVVRSFLSGALFALAAGFRAATVASVLVLFVVMILLKARRTQALLAFFGGALAATVSVLLATHITGHLSLVLAEGCDYLYASIVENAPTTHRLGALVSGYLLSLVKTLAKAVTVYAVVGFAATAKREGQWFAFVVGIAGVISIFWAWKGQLLTILPLVLALEVIKAIKLPIRIEPQYVALVGVILTLLFPFGSTNGIKNACFALWFLVPGVLTLTSKGKDSLVARTVATLLLVVGVVSAIYRPYWDKPITQLKCEFAFKPAGGIRTTCERVAVVRDAIEALERFGVKRGEEIFVYQNSPMMYILSNTKPWLPYPWPYLILPDRIAAAMGEKERLALPVAVLREKWSTFGAGWPEVKSTPKESREGSVGHKEVYDAFLRKHDYSVVWENEMFEILMAGVKLDDDKAR